MHFPSKEKNKIKEGMPLKFKIDETGKTYTGKVYEISGDIDPGSRTFQVKALIDNKAKKLSAGMSGVYTGNL
jgi:multidrug efflux pump subunit AcrA (membrane-fusion protein)